MKKTSEPLLQKVLALLLHPEAAAHLKDPPFPSITMRYYHLYQVEGKHLCQVLLPLVEGRGQVEPRTEPGRGSPATCV